MSAHDDLTGRPPEPAVEFPTPSLDDWAAAARKSLRGKPLGDLTIPLDDGIVVRSVATAADVAQPSGYPGVAPFLRGSRAILGAVDGWQACVRCDHPDPTTAARQLQAAADHGLTSAWIALDATARLARDPEDGTVPDPDGVVIEVVPDLEPLVAALGPDAAIVHLDGGGNGVALAAATIAALRRRGVEPRRLHGTLGWDPLAALAADGELPYGLDRSLELLADVAAWADRCAGGIAAVTVSTLPYSQAGATPVQELACAAATGVEYLRRMTSAGLDWGVACLQLRFRVAVGLDLFGEIAKLRALRWIWSRIVEACGGNDQQQRASIHAVTSPRWLTQRDPWTNMLRATTAAFAAIAGGAEVVTVLPFDAAIGPSDDFSQRIAANLHTILRDESHLGRIVDPAGGSYLVERLTTDLAQAAWTRFQDLERAGGMAAALVDGGLPAQLAAAASRRAEAVATRRRPITGVSSYANLDEAPVERPSVSRPRASAGDRPSPAPPARLLEAVERAATAGRGNGSVFDAAVAALEGGATLSQVGIAIRGSGSATRVEPLPAHRDSEPFERLRDASDARRAATGVRPRVILLSCGSAAGQRNCVDFARGIFAAGGIEAAAEQGFDGDVDDAVAAFARSGAHFAAVCGAGSDWPSSLAELAHALRTAGAVSVVAVSPSAIHPDQNPPAGADLVIGAGDDIVAALSALTARSGGGRG